VNARPAEQILTDQTVIGSTPRRLAPLVRQLLGSREQMKVDRGVPLGESKDIDAFSVRNSLDLCREHRNDLSKLAERLNRQVG
jgi:hypothetical protein